MPRKYKPEVHAFIAAHVAGTTTQELARITNAAFGTNFTAASMKSYKANHKLRNGRGTGRIKGAATKRFPQQVKDYVFAHYKGKQDTARCATGSLNSSASSTRRSKSSSITPATA